MSSTTEFSARQPFTRSAGLAAGLTPHQLRSPAYVRIFRRIYVAREVPRTVAVRARAALLACPEGAVVSYRTAAAIWGVDLPSSQVHVTVRPHQVVAVPGIRSRQRAAVPASVRRQGVLVTTPTQTFCDLGADLDLVELVVVGDRLVRRRHATVAQIVEAAEQWTGWAREKVLRAASLVREGVDSPPESRLRMLLVLAGLPEPKVNHKLFHDNGDLRRRFELAYEQLLIAIEYHGRDHRTKDEIWVSDIGRREEVGRESWKLVEVISEGLYGDPLETLRRVEQARLERGARPTGIFREEFRRYFPGRDGVA